MHHPAAFVYFKLSQVLIDQKPTISVFGDGPHSEER